MYCGITGNVWEWESRTDRSTARSAESSHSAAIGPPQGPEYLRTRRYATAPAELHGARARDADKRTNAALAVFRQSATEPVLGMSYQWLMAPSLFSLYETD